MGKRKKSKVPVTLKSVTGGTVKKAKTSSEVDPQKDPHVPVVPNSILKNPMKSNSKKNLKNNVDTLRTDKESSDRDNLDDNIEKDVDSDSYSDFEDSDEELFVQESAPEEKGEDNEKPVKELNGESGNDNSGSEESDWTDASEDSESDVDEEENDASTPGEASANPVEAESETDSEEDEVAANIKKAKEPKAREYPYPIKLETEAADVSFHPYQEAVAIGDMNGHVLIYKYSNDENQLLYDLKNHQNKSIRCLEFSEDGGYLISACRGKRIVLVDAQTAKPRAVIKDAHNSAVYCLRPIDENLFASGDDDGCIKVWDTREKPKAVIEWKEMDEFVTSMVVDEGKRTLLATSGEGTLTAFNLKQRKMKVQSEVYESEFNCVGFVRDGSKVVTGSGDGMVHIFNKDEYGYHSDTFGDHPDAINAMIPITESVVATACEDGAIRAMNIFPHRFLGIIGSHERTSNKLNGYPIERLDVSTCGHYLASVSHDKQVKFWNISYFEDLAVDRGQKSARNKKKSNRKNRQDYHLPSSNMKNLSDFFEDLGGE